MSDNAKKLHIKKVFSQKPSKGLPVHSSTNDNSSSHNSQQTTTAHISTRDSSISSDSQQSTTTHKDSLMPSNSQHPTTGYISTTKYSQVFNVSDEECQIDNIALSTLQNIWSKAEKLIRSEGHIIKVPWLDDKQARLVKSYSSPQPHLVTRNPKKIFFVAIRIVKCLNAFLFVACHCHSSS